jgi:PilX N-terminal
MIRSNSPQGRRQRGIASLIVVALLFFVVSLVTAYTNRNLIFEQRTSVNQLRSTQAFEAAEAGIEWALSMLNGGSIGDDSCAPSADPDDETFRERYLETDPETGVVSARDPYAGPVADRLGRGTVWPTCVFSGGNWSCTCPDAGAASPDGDGPAFRIRLSGGGPLQPGLVLVESNGCTRLDDQCLDFPAASVGGEGRASVSVLVALRSALRELPLATLTVREDMAVTGAGISVYNSEPLGSGVTVLAGGTISGAAALGSVGGTPGDRSIVSDDSGLQAITTGDRMFSVSFQATPELFERQPGLRVLDECAGGCSASDLVEIAGANRGRILYVDGDLDIDADLGTADAPVFLVVTGSVGFSAAATVHGAIYSRAEEWQTSGGGTLRGAIIAEGRLVGDGTTTFIYDRAVLRNLLWGTGSYVRVPGSWADFKDAP